MTTKERYNHLTELKMYIESFPFQEFIMKPLFEEMDKQKNAYDCESLRELSQVKGKRQGLKFLIDILKRVEKDIINTKDELDS